MNKTSFSEYLKMIESTGLPFRYTETAGTVTLEYMGQKHFFSDGEIEARYLNVIKKTKESIIENYDGVKPPKFRFYESRVLPGKYKMIYQTDINSAYSTSAYNMGLIDEDLYKKIMEAPKGVRLAAIGSAATIKTVAENDGDEYINIEQVYSEVGRNAFFAIAKNVADLMAGIFPHCFFYWCDAVFHSDENFDYVKNALLDAGYKFKTTEILLMDVRCGDFGTIIYTTTRGRTTDDLTEICIKKYMFPSEKKKEEIKKIQKKKSEKIIKKVIKTVILRQNTKKD